MNKYKVCVYAICKDEEQFVDRWMDAVNEANLIVVLDTGSTDNTVQKLRERGAIVYTDIINPWRFDVARNIALDHIPKDTDICVSNDLDEVFEMGWRQKLEDAWQPHNTSAKYMFTFSYNSDGSADKQYVMEKIHCRHGFRWVHPVHESLEYTGNNEDKNVDNNKENSVWVNNLVLNHYPDLSKPRSQYLPLLELSTEENPNNDRTAFWLGREYMYYGKNEQSIETLKKHLQMPTATWDEERSASMRFISKCYQAKGNLREAKVWLYKAIAECPRVREPYLQMSQLGYLENDWPLVYLMTIEALKITEKSGSYLLEFEAWDFNFYDLGAISSYQLGLFDVSYQFAEKACSMSPNDSRLINNLELIKLKLTNMGGNNE